jgi:shikimate kinase
MLVPGIAEAIAHGAATIVNAIATGEGAAFGVDLWTKAQVKLTNEPSVVKGEIASDSAESTLLIERTIVRVLRHFGFEKQFGARVKTWSNIPVARGLKSSSAAANAVALAAVGALGQYADDLSIIDFGVDAAFDAKVTVTGAFDDACASYFGGVVVTDNLKRRIVSCSFLPADLSVLFFVPKKKSYTGNSDVKRLRAMAPLVKIAFREAEAGNFLTALSLNGLIYSSAIGFDSSIAVDALNAGALAAGLCGKGPALTALVSEDKLDQVKTAFCRYEGEIISANLNSTKARIVS